MADISAQKAGKIKEQIEFYFSDSNMPRDKFLLGVVAKNNGAVPISVLLTFKRIQQLNASAEDIAAALADSEVVAVSEDKTSLSRVAPLPESLNLNERCVYVKGLTKDSTIESTKELFGQAGKVLSVRLRYRPATADIPEKQFKGSAFVEFETVAEAEAAAALKLAPPEGEQCFPELNPLVEIDGEQCLRIEMKQAYLDRKKAERNAKFEAKKGKKKKGGDGGKGAAAAEPAPTFEKGCVVKVGPLGDTTSREDLRDAFALYGDVAYIDHNRGNKDAWVRFADPAGAAKAIAEMTEEVRKFGDEPAAISVIEGEDEEKYMAAVFALQKAKGGRNKGKKGGRRNNNNRGQKRNRDDGEEPKAKRAKTDGDDKPAEKAAEPAAPAAPAAAAPAADKAE